MHLNFDESLSRLMFAPNSQAPAVLHCVTLTLEVGTVMFTDNTSDMSILASHAVASAQRQVGPTLGIAYPGAAIPPAQ